jgi:hypothetical protein
MRADDVVCSCFNLNELIVNKFFYTSQMIDNFGHFCAFWDNSPFDIKMSGEQ